MPRSFEQLCSAFDTIINQGYEASIFYFPNYTEPVDVRLEKKISGKATLNVRGEGKTIKEAFENAINNFPSHPLDGTE